eukprot:scaffold13324_cov206-Alexandrium_tamarense.AAC.12
MERTTISELCQTVHYYTRNPSPAFEACLVLVLQSFQGRTFSVQKREGGGDVAVSHLPASSSVTFLSHLHHPPCHPSSTLYHPIIYIHSPMHQLSRLLSKLFPVIATYIIAKYALPHINTILHCSNTLSNFVRITYTVLFAIAMEYISRYSHCYLWHGKFLWWINGSHHHQYPAVGSTPVYGHNNPYVSPAIELNDAFAVFFATIATLAMWIGSEPPSTLTKDCSIGIGLGVTLYGLSYFVGHDIVAHERLGKGVANALRRAFPYMEQCASVHIRYHHKLTKRSNDSDPYGAPYGFWLGPSEVECLNRGQWYAPMPMSLKAISWIATLIFFASTIHSSLSPAAQAIVLLGCVGWCGSGTLSDNTTTSRRIGKLLSLNWQSTPSRLMPHGLSGLISVGIGSYLIFGHSLVGDLKPYTMQQPPYLIILYATATSWNALGGYMIVNTAPPNTRMLFRRCAILQVCLSYFIVRFLPHSSVLLIRLESNTITTSLRCLDLIVTISAVVCTLSFFDAVVDMSKQSVVLGQSIAFGIIGILLLSVYPIQLSLQGEEWWSCIQNRYPMQASGMIAYIYVPATVTFSLFLFGATLYQRKIMSASEYGIISLMVILVCLLATVLSQEIHIPDVSTQRIYLPCEDPAMDSLEEKVLEALDFSRYARSILTTVLGIKFESPA